MVSCSELPGWAGVSSLVAARDLVVQVDVAVGWPISKTPLAVDAAQQLVVARLQAVQAGAGPGR